MNYYSYINTSDTYLDESSHATYKGITIKTAIFLLITVLVGVGVAFLLPNIVPSKLELFITFVGVSSFIGFIALMIGRFFERTAKYAGFIYSFCEGVVLGTLTTIIDMFYPGTGTLAIVATVVIFGVMLVLFSFGIIRNGSIMRMIFFGLFASILALSIFDLIYVLSTGSSDYWLSIGIQSLILVYSVISLTFNFAEAEAVVKYGAPKRTEWSVALGMEFALVFIYVNILRILAILGNRR